MQIMGLGGGPSMVMRYLVAVALIAAEMATATALLVVAPAPAGAQRFEDFFPFFQQRGRRGWFDPPEREERPVDYSKAPVPKKADAVPQTPIMVFGDNGGLARIRSRAGLRR
jgi:uncharacterized protein